ncbi:MAG: glutamine--tRNA ligase, partial [Ginsengibacter sp.]
VLDPVKLTITNYEDGKTEMLTAENYFENDVDIRQVGFSKTLWIEREDFMEVPVKKYFRLAPGTMVRLKHAYIIKCEGFEKDNNGRITEIHCSYIPESKSGNDTSGLTVKSAIHWVSADHASTAEVRLYDRLFTEEDVASSEKDFKELINPDSLAIIPGAIIEKSLQEAEPNVAYQFIRKGYFCLDKDSTSEHLVFNRTTTLKDAWAKEVKKK